MNAANPHFANINRAPHEFGYLMKILPANFSAVRAMSTDERLQAKAAIDHASNAGGTLMSGMEAIGHLLFSAATNESYPMESTNLAKIGMLITHIAVQAQFLQEQEGDLQASLDYDDQRATNAAAPAKKGGTK